MYPPPNNKILDHGPPMHEVLELTTDTSNGIKTKILHMYITIIRMASGVLSTEGLVFPPICIFKCLKNILSEE